MKSAFLYCIILLISQVTIAQPLDSTYTNHTFFSEAFQDDRTITVQLPPQYYDNPEDSFMVTYILDAQGPHYFSMQTHLLDYLSSRYSIIPTIIVGIHSPNRYAEFTPPDSNPDSRFNSKYHEFQQHIDEEVFPWVENNFRTANFRAIVGHSRGGSYIVNTLFGGYEDMYDGYLAISPALGSDDFQSLKVMGDRLKKTKPLTKYLYFSGGTLGDREQFFEMCAEKMDSILLSHPSPNLHYHFTKHKDREHFSTVAPALVDGMTRMATHHTVMLNNLESISKDIKADDYLTSFYNDLKAKEQFSYIPPSGYYRSIAGQYFDNEKYQRAAELFLWIEKNQGGINRWWELLNLGVALKKGNIQLDAQPYFDRALILLDENKENFGDNYGRVEKDVHRQILDVGGKVK